MVQLYAFVLRNAVALGWKLAINYTKLNDFERDSQIDIDACRLYM